MSRRIILKAAAAGALALATSTYMQAALAADTIKVGILHSLSGTMAISETSLKDVALMTIAEINAKGGVLGKTGRRLRPGVELALFAEKARSWWPGQGRRRVRLMASVFGKSVLPCSRNNSCVYPVQYEGEEMEKNVF